MGFARPARRTALSLALWMTRGPQGMVEGTRVEAHQGMHHLVLGGGSHVSMHGQGGRLRVDLRCGRAEILA